MRTCSRCGGDKNIEKHHIKHRANGGTNDPENLVDLCRGCHDYQHTKENILAHMKRNKERNQLARFKIWEYRLHVLEKFNTPELVKERGYKPYFDDVKTHYMSREVKAFIPKDTILKLESE